MKGVIFKITVSSAMQVLDMHWAAGYTFQHSGITDIFQVRNVCDPAMDQLYQVLPRYTAHHLLLGAICSRYVQHLDRREPETIKKLQVGAPRTMWSRADTGLPYDLCLENTIGSPTSGYSPHINMSCADWCANSDKSV